MLLETSKQTHFSYEIADKNIPSHKPFHDLAIPLVKSEHMYFIYNVVDIFSTHGRVTEIRHESMHYLSMPRIQ